MIRLLDILFSFFGLILLLPVLIIISFLILILNGPPVFFFQKRVGRNGREFRLVKFRTMRKDSEQEGFITLGTSDNRITGLGRFLRKYKLDELPQLLNVLVGTMSMVGPRPEVLKYVALYNDEQRKVLTIKPGITDYASIRFVDENRMAGEVTEPEKHYIQEVMPRKLELSLIYVNKPGLLSYFDIIFKTLFRIFLRR